MGQALDPLSGVGGSSSGVLGSGSAGNAAGAASIASLGFSAFSSIAKGEGTKAADDFQAERAERAAKFGRTQADLADVTMRDELNTTLSNIDVIRAAGRVDPTSPTTAAVGARQALVSDRQRNAAVLSQRGQADEDDASARYLRQAGDYALSSSYIDAGTKIAGAAAKAFLI